MGSALSATPQLLAKLAELPPADDDPELDVEVEMHRPPTRFTLRRFSGPFRSGLTLGLILVMIDTGLMLLGPFFVKRGIDRGVMPGKANGFRASGYTAHIVASPTALWSGCDP